MATCVFKVGDAGGSEGVFGIWFKFPSLPAAATAIVDVYAVGVGYHRVVLKTDGTIRAQSNYLGFVNDVQLGSGAAPVDTWLWVSGCCAAIPNHIHAYTTCWKQDGTVFGSQDTTLTSLGPSATWAAAFSIGQAPSGGGFAAWPLTAGWELSKPIINGSYSTGPKSPPSADFTGGTPGTGDSPAAGHGGYYNCRASVGATATLADDSGNGFDLTGSFNIVADGPYAS